MCSAQFFSPSCFRKSNPDVVPSGTVKLKLLVTVKALQPHSRFWFLHEPIVLICLVEDPFFQREWRTLNLTRDHPTFCHQTNFFQMGGQKGMITLSCIASGAKISHFGPQTQVAKSSRQNGSGHTCACTSTSKAARCALSCSTEQRCWVTAVQQRAVSCQWWRTARTSPSAVVTALRPECSRASSRPGAGTAAEDDDWDSACK